MDMSLWHALSCPAPPIADTAQLSWWQSMVCLGAPLVEKVARPILVYAFLVAGLRLAGKRELAQLNAFDLVVLLTLSNTVQNAIIGNEYSVTGGIIGAITLLLVNAAVVRFLYSHQRLDRIVEGDPDVLIEDGKLREDRLQRELITLSELQAAARKQGFSALDEVDGCVLEPGGGLTFSAKKPTAEAMRYEELVRRLDAIADQLAGLRAPAGSPSAGA